MAEKPKDAKECVMTFTYKLPWETVARAYLSRYPRHEAIPMMLAQELTLVEWNPTAQALKVNRRMKADLEGPYWLKRLFGIYHAYMWQTVTVDFPNRRMVSESSSNPASKLYAAGELATWEADPADPENSTVFTVKAWLMLTKFFLSVQTIIESILLRTFQGQFANARKIDHVFIEAITKEDAKREAGAEISPKTLLAQSVSSWIDRSLRYQKAENVDKIVPIAFGESEYSHVIEIGPTEGKLL